MIAVGLVSFLWYRLTRPEKETFLFPENLRGAVYIIYDQKNGEPKVYENNRRLYQIPDNGILFTQFKPNTEELTTDIFLLTAMVKEQKL